MMAFIWWVSDVDFARDNGINIYLKMGILRVQWFAMGNVEKTMTWITNKGKYDTVVYIIGSFNPACQAFVVV